MQYWIGLALTLPYVVENGSTRARFDAMLSLIDLFAFEKEECNQRLFTKR